MTPLKTDNHEGSEKIKQYNCLFKINFHLPFPAMISLLVLINQVMHFQTFKLLWGKIFGEMFCTVHLIDKF